MPTTNKMVSENKGKEGKPPRLDLGYKRNNTHEFGNNNKRGSNYNKNGRKNNIEIKEKHMKEIWRVSWKWKKRQKRKNMILERREKVEDTRQN